MILIISASRSEGISLSDMLYHMGVLSVCATPERALTEPLLFCSAAVIIRPEAINNITEYITALKSKTELLAFAISDLLGDAEKMLFADIFKPNEHAPRIYKKIERVARGGKGPVPGEYRALGIDASALLKSARLHDFPIKFTKTETMVLRALLRAYPNGICASDILRYAFRADRLPSPSSIRTHVSIINKKCQAYITGHLIEFATGEGYRLREIKT